MKRLSLIALFILILCAAPPRAMAAGTLIGVPCAGDSSAVGREGVVQCVGGAYQAGPLWLGPSSEACVAGQAGLMQGGGAMARYCTGTGWTALGGHFIGSQLWAASPNRLGEDGTGLSSLGAEGLQIGILGVSRAQITGTGLGIGTTPTQLLDVAAGSAIKVGSAYLSAGGDAVRLGMNQWHDGTQWNALSAGGVYQIGPVDHDWFLHDAGGAATALMNVNAGGVLSLPYKLGVRTSTPNEAVQVAGGVQIGTTPGSCGATVQAGVLRWTGGAFQICDGSSWRNLKMSGGTPNAFAFTNQTEVTRATLTTSNAVTLSGDFANLTATCGGTCSAIAKNGVWGGTTVTDFNPGDTITIRQTSSASWATTTSATVTVGPTTSTAWTVRTIMTGGTPNAFAFTNQTEVGRSMTITSNAVMLSGDFANHTATCGSGCTAIARNGVWGGATVTGFNPGDTIAIRQTSSASWATTTSATVVVGPTISTAWTVSTYVSGGTPNAFSFTNQTEVTRATLTTSNAVTLSGDFASLTATCGGTCSAIAKNGVWGGTTVTGFNPGDTITIRQTSSASWATTTSATVTVGPTTSTAWTVRTPLSGGTPNAFAFNNQTGVSLGTTVYSNAVTLSGDFYNRTATCGSGCTNIARNGVWSGTTVTGFNPGDTIAIAQTASGSLASTTYAYVTVQSGTTSSAWAVTTIISYPLGGGSSHTYADCTNAGGSVTTPSQTGYAVCQFAIGSCPGGWTSTGWNYYVGQTCKQSGHLYYAGCNECTSPTGWYNYHASCSFCWRSCEVNCVCGCTSVACYSTSTHSWCI